MIEQNYHYASQKIDAENVNSITCNKQASYHRPSKAINMQKIRPDAAIIVIFTV